MNKKVLIEIFKNTWFYLLAYAKTFLLPKVKEAFQKGKEQFIQTLWNSIKDEATEQVQTATEFVLRFFDSPSFKQKEEEILDVVFKNIKLPFILKPLKPLLRRMLKEKFEKLIKENIKKLNKIA